MNMPIDTIFVLITTISTLFRKRLPARTQYLVCAVGYSALALSAIVLSLTPYRWLLLAVPLLWLGYMVAKHQFLHSATVGICEAVFYGINGYCRELGVIAPLSPAGLLCDSTPVVWREGIPFVRIALQQCPDIQPSKIVANAVNARIASLASNGMLVGVPRQKIYLLPAYIMRCHTVHGDSVVMEFMITDFPGTLAYCDKYRGKTDPKPQPVTTSEFDA